MESSDIKNFFNGQTIFVSGGTGFLGKVLIEKLLRECKGVQKIYLLVRSKKGKSTEDRFRAIFDFPCFDVVKSQNLNLEEKVCLISGDCQQPLLGISENDLKVLKEETNLVFHLASSVRFDQSLKEATFNVRATRDLLNIAETMPNLKAFVYVSTAFSNCIHTHIEEKPYESPIKFDNLLSMVNSFDDNTLEKITPLLLQKWPNTYVFTKSISENLVANAAQNFPVAIIRPAIIVNAVSEPLEGWIDNIYGPVGIGLGAACGVIRTFHGKRDASANLVPVDYVCNCVLAATWKVALDKSSIASVYNYVDFSKKQLSWGMFSEILWRNNWIVFSNKAIWHACFKLQPSKLLHEVCVILQHTLPAYIIDSVLFCLGKPTIAVKAYRKIDKTLSLVSHFATRSWQFDCDNVKNLWTKMKEADKNLFFFDMKNMNWEQYLSTCKEGASVYILKNIPDYQETIMKKMKYSLLFIAHYTVVGIFWYFVYKSVTFMLTLFW